MIQEFEVICLKSISKLGIKVGNKYKAYIDDNMFHIWIYHGWAYLGNYLDVDGNYLDVDEYFISVAKWKAEWRDKQIDSIFEE